MNTQFALQSIIFLLVILSFGLYHYNNSYNDFMMITLRQFPNACAELNVSYFIDFYILIIYTN